VYKLRKKNEYQNYMCVLESNSNLYDVLEIKKGKEIDTLKNVIVERIHFNSDSPTKRYAKQKSSMMTLMQ